METDYLEAVEINPGGPATASIIWLHGLGADGHDFEPLVPQLGIVEPHGVRVVLPHAPLRNVTINGGMRMPAWYDIRQPDLARDEDRAGIEASAAQVEALIEREVARGIPSGRIVLAGFSQGGAIVLHAGLRHREALGGIVALSTYLPLADSLDAELSAAGRAVPILMAHGMQDPVVPVMLAIQSRDRLIAQGCQVDWHSYPMQHAVCPEEVLAIADWLRRRLPPA